MKKRILICLILVSSVLTMNAQTWIGSLDVNGNLWRNGNVGIGTINPITTSKLEVHGITSIGQFTNGTAVIDAFNSYAYFGCNTATNGIAIGPNGNVGIGTTSPIAKLHIDNGANTDGAVLATSSENNKLVVSSGMTQPVYVSTFRITQQFDNDRNNGYISFNRGGSTAGGFLTFGSWGQERLRIDGVGNIGIGTLSPAYKLDVCGTIRAKEIKIDLLGGCDFVFKSDYKLMDLKTLEQFVQTNQHLPEIASEKEMVENGINMKELQMKLLQKMEEMTLYIIEQNKKNEQQSERIEQQNQEMKILKEKIGKIEKASK